MPDNQTGRGAPIRSATKHQLAQFSTAPTLVRDVLTEPNR
jgi:hypothetical protein